MAIIRKRERERQTDRQTDRQTETEKRREGEGVEERGGGELELDKIYFTRIVV